MQTAPGVNPHDALYATAQAVLPGGVSSSIRYNKALGRPFYIARGEGAYLYDLEGREYVDLLTPHGATLLGHNHMIPDLCTIGKCVAGGTPLSVFGAGGRSWNISGRWATPSTAAPTTAT